MVDRFAFLDTEFTGLDQRWPRLISLALVPEESDDWLYIETPSESWRDKANLWVVQNVMPLLRGDNAVVQLGEVRQLIVDWVKRNGPLRIVSDSPEHDFAFMRAILDPWDENVAREPLRFDSRTLGRQFQELLETTRAASFSPEFPEHNALADALALRRMWFAAKVGAQLG